MKKERLKEIADILIGQLEDCYEEHSDVLDMLDDLREAGITDAELTELGYGDLLEDDEEEDETDPDGKIKPERIKEIKELFQDLAKQAIDYYELKSYVEGMWESGEFSDEEYDMIVDRWTKWLPDEDQE